MPVTPTAFDNGVLPFPIKRDACGILEDAEEDVNALISPYLDRKNDMDFYFGVLLCHVACCGLFFGLLYQTKLYRMQQPNNIIRANEAPMMPQMSEVWSDKSEDGLKLAAV
eukprot:2945421-Amphidinium_carterae.1